MDLPAGKVTLSVVVPAFNEERGLGPTIGAILRSAERAEAVCGIHTEIVLVDNGSTDQTAKIGEALGARVVHETDHNIARVRNRGAHARRGEILVFVDADTLVPERLLERIYREATREGCAGGVVEAVYRPKHLSARLYLGLWRVLARVARLAQGATQFCRGVDFDEIGGYDESIFMGEDADFLFRLRRHARARGKRVRTIRDLRVLTSARRFDQWSPWRTLAWTNPVAIVLLRRVRAAWKGWYEAPPR